MFVGLMLCGAYATTTALTHASKRLFLLMSSVAPCCRLGVCNEGVHPCQPKALMYNTIGCKSDHNAQVNTLDHYTGSKSDNDRLPWGQGCHCERQNFELNHVQWVCQWKSLPMSHHRYITHWLWPQKWFDIIPLIAFHATHIILWEMY